MTFKEQADIWIRSSWGRRFRIGLLAGTIVSYPVYYLISHGPLLKQTFKAKYDVDYQLPPHLQLSIDEQLEKFRVIEARLPKDSKVTFSLQKNLKHLDSIAEGSLGVRFGAQIGLPLYTRFTNEEEALKYCRENLKDMKVSEVIKLSD